MRADGGRGLGISGLVAWQLKFYLTPLFHALKEQEP